MGNRFREKVTEEGLESSEGRVRISENPEFGEQSSELADAANNSAPRTPHSELNRKSDRAARGIGRVLGGDMLANRLALRQIPLVLLCLFYLLLIVGNRYRVETLSREKAATEERINYLREHRIQMQKQYQQSVKISQVAEALSESGVGITSGPPYEI